MAVPGHFLPMAAMPSMGIVQGNVIRCYHMRTHWDTALSAKQEGVEDNVCLAAVHCQSHKDNGQPKIAPS